MCCVLSWFPRKILIWINSSNGNVSSIGTRICTSPLFPHLSEVTTSFDFSGRFSAFPNILTPVKTTICISQLREDSVNSNCEFICKHVIIVMPLRFSLFFHLNPPSTTFVLWVSPCTSLLSLIITVIFSILMPWLHKPWSVAASLLFRSLEVGERLQTGTLHSDDSLEWCVKVFK